MPDAISQPSKLTVSPIPGEKKVKTDGATILLPAPPGLDMIIVFQFILY